MICKQGIKVLIPLGIQDKATRSLDQVVHEFAYAIDRKYLPDQIINTFTTSGMTPVENFASHIQNWFGAGAPSNVIPPREETILKDLFTSRVTFSCEDYRP
jgi:hypothetical protein